MADPGESSQQERGVRFAPLSERRRSRSSGGLLQDAAAAAAAAAADTAAQGERESLV